MLFGKGTIARQPVLRLIKTTSHSTLTVEGYQNANVKTQINWSDTGINSAIEREG